MENRYDASQEIIIKIWMFLKLQMKYLLYYHLCYSMFIVKDEKVRDLTI